MYDIMKLSLITYLMEGYNMNTIPKTFAYKNPAHNCFIYRNGAYDLLSYDYFIRQLPSLPLEDENYLSQNGISYAIANDRCEIYDPETKETETISLPVYVAKFGTYTYIGKSHEEITWTEETVVAAERIYKEASNGIKMQQGQEQLSKDALWLKELFGEREIAFVSNLADMLPYPGDFSTPPATQEYSLYVNGVYSFHGYLIGYIVLDLEKTRQESCLELKVPGGLIGKVIGSNAQNINRVRDTLNTKTGMCIRRINVMAES